MRAPLWTRADLVRASGGVLDTGHTDASVHAESRYPITGISIDTRALQPGDLFVALKDARDGHDFVSAAFAAGAAAALVSTSYVRRQGDGLLIRVDEPLLGLERLGAAARGRLAPEARVVAVTGSAGKTGTKEMLRAALAALGATHAPEKSFNNHWGVPLTLARMPADTRFGVFEIGMNHAGEIRPLTKLVRPHVAIVTNVLPVHVGNFPDGETGVANAKAEIFEGLEPGGTAIIPADSLHRLTLQRHATTLGARTIAFGTTTACDISLVEAADEAGGTRVTVRSSRASPPVTYRLGMPGRHIAVNSLAVVATLRALGLGDRLDLALAPLAHLTPPAGRGSRNVLVLPGGTAVLIDESYNANPASTRAALGELAHLATVTVSRKIAVLGDMLELGDGAADYHRALVDVASLCDVVFACGPNMRLLYEELPADRRGGWAPTSADLVPDVLAAVQPGDAIMIKGSLGSRMAPIVEALKRKFAT